jgi:hypothetical protein
LDLKDLREKSAPWPALDLDDDIERIGDVALDSEIRNFDTALQYARHDSGNPLWSRIRMDGRESPAVSCVEKLQKVERFTTANLTKEAHHRVRNESANQCVRSSPTEPDICCLPSFPHSDSAWLVQQGVAEASGPSGN